MSVTNEFLQFATGGGANVEPQATYLADSNRTSGQQAGVASSALNNKAIRQATYITSIFAQFIGNQTNTNLQDNTATAQFLAQLSAAVQAIPPVITTYTSGTGTYNLPYAFFLSSGSATVGATYTNNSITYTVVSTIAAGSVLFATGSGAPLVSGTLTKAGGTGDATITFYAVRTPLYLEVQMVGGGGGGAGSGTSGSGGTGGNGGNSSFGTSLLVASGGGEAVSSGAGSGGTSSLGSGPVGVALQGGSGQTSDISSVTTVGVIGGQGGGSFFGGGCYVGTGGTAANTGCGGGGGSGSGSASIQTGGGGGGAGGFIQAFISAPAVTYAYSVGAAGTAGGAGTGGNAGLAGSAGLIIVEAHYQ